MVEQLPSAPDSDLEVRFDGSRPNKRLAPWALSPHVLWDFVMPFLFYGGWNPISLRWACAGDLLAAAGGETHTLSWPLLGSASISPHPTDY